MEINGTKNGSALDIALAGRLDTVTSPELEEYLKSHLDGVEALAIDLTETQYVSSAGLRVILFAQKEMMKSGGTLVVRHPNEYIMEVFEATRFTDFLTIEE